MRHSVVLIIAIVVVVAGTAGVAVWLVTDRGQLAKSREIRPAPHQYDTTSGQEMRPRWNSQEAVGHDTPNN